MTSNVFLKIPQKLKDNIKKIKSNSNRYITSIMITFLYAFGFKTSIYIFPVMIFLFISIKNLIQTMYIQKEKITKLEEIRDFEYSIIISQSSDDDLISSIRYYLEHYKAGSLLYEEINIMFVKLSNNGNLEKEIHDMKISKELRSFLKVLSYTLSSGMDIKKVAILEYEALIRRIEAEKEIWASFSDKRLEVMIMIVMPPIIIFISKIGIASNMQSREIIETIITSVSILLISSSCKIIEEIIGVDK